MLQSGEVLIGLYDSPLGGTPKAVVLDHEQFIEWENGVAHGIQNRLGFYALPGEKVNPVQED